MSLIRHMPAEAEGLIALAAATGFRQVMYGVDVLDGQFDAPEQLLGAGFSAGFVDGYPRRMREDPIRRMAARGEIVVSNTPFLFENYGERLSVGAGRVSVGDRAHLRWTWGEGLRTGVSFRIRLDRGRQASLNFFADRASEELRLDAAMERLFLIGHRLHALLEPRLPRRSDRLLSGRETECLELIADGKSNPEIAALLGLSLNTVKEHVQSLFSKLDVTGRAQAVARGHALAYLD